MTTGFRIAMAVGFGVALLQLPAAAQDKSAAANVATNAPKLSPQEQKERWSYAIGVNIGNNIKRGGVDLDVDVLATAMKDMLAGKESKLTEQQSQEAFKTYQTESRSKQDELRKQSAEKNKKAGDAFLAENKNKPGVKTHTVSLPGGGTAELQYKVLTEGAGVIPKSNDVVLVNYHGRLLNGKEFDSSAKHGDKPARFPVNRVVRGWTEALQLMKTGAKWEIYLPANLAYGDNGNAPTIEPGATLVFDMELTGIEASPPAVAPPASVAPLTSDVIKVPSAEELKKGAKIEVIKAEDIEKMTNSAAQKPEKK
ncbi:MAG: FKBP-type peptidyl-prolyl cis-trans isomerase [Verrucomicrobiota bacterium]